MASIAERKELVAKKVADLDAESEWLRKKAGWAGIFFFACVAATGGVYMLVDNSLFCLIPLIPGCLPGIFFGAASNCFGRIAREREECHLRLTELNALSP